MARVLFVYFFAFTLLGYLKTYDDHALCGLYRDPNGNRRIYQGDDVAYGEFPWVVAINLGGKTSLSSGSDCTGGILNERWILTAAHCLYDDAGQTFTIWHGRRRVYDKTGGAITLATIAQVNVFWPTDSSSGDPDTSIDIGLIYLGPKNQIALPSVPDELSQYTVNRMCLNQNPAFSYRPGDTTDTLFMAGFGNSHDRSKSYKQLLKMNGKLASKEHVRLFSVDTHEQFGWLDPNSKQHSCSGDSGAPVVIYQPSKVTGIPGFASQRAVAVGVHSSRAGEDGCVKSKGYKGFHPPENAVRIDVNMKWIEDKIYEHDCTIRKSFFSYCRSLFGRK